MKRSHCFVGVFGLFLGTIVYVSSGAVERADVVVAKDGSGDFKTIQEAVDSIPEDNKTLKIVLIKNGIYVEKVIIRTDGIALVGEDRDSTRVVFHQPFYYDSTYADGRAVINIMADDIVLANLTVENTQPETKIHGFTVYGESSTRTIIINCSILSNGGDTLALWNGETGMYYLNTLYIKGAVDFLCPRGWCYAENVDFFCTRETTPLWHDGSKNPDQKLVVKNAFFDGATAFRLGRNHHDGAFYLLDCVFSDKMLDLPFFRPPTSPAPYKWGRRTYFSRCIRPAGNYDWHHDNLYVAPGSPAPEQITATWTFANAWDPEANMPSVLPMSFLPKPDNGGILVGLNPVLTWIPGRNAIRHRIHFGKTDPLPFVMEQTEQRYSPGRLESETVYYWRVDEVEGQRVVEGRIWTFRTL